ncbi:MAG TPA: hypothetical protein VKF32_03230 [Thermoanaerobaculia bacterium]|nr:hypothetical protein [Thermoanaerobaculia bacterium]
MRSRTWLGSAAVSFALGVRLAAATGAPLPVVRAELVPSQPPSPVRDVILSSAGPGAGWERIPGSWHWISSKWIWVPARWQRRPASAARWVPAEYARLDGRWRYVPGHWSLQRVVPPPADRARHAQFLTRKSPRGEPR